jgi:putative hydrolase of the HAD superfamily
MADRWRAALLGRNGVLARTSAAKVAERDRAIGQAIGRPGFRLSPEVRARINWRLMEDSQAEPINTLEREHAFRRRWYRLILEDQGTTEDAEALAAELYARFPSYALMELYPETVSSLEALKRRGYRLGVLSDTFPSLELSLKALAIDRYFQTFTVSAVVGLEKPDVRIFQAALQALGTATEETLFVSTALVASDNARALGITAFHLDRTLAEPQYADGEIGTLDHLLAWLDVAQSKDEG